MRRWRQLISGLGIAILAMAFPATAHAQTQEQSDSLERWARYNVNLPTCEELGIGVPVNAGTTAGIVNLAMTKEAESWGLTYVDASPLVLAAMHRQGRIYNDEWGEYLREPKITDEVMRKAYIKYGQECIDAANDIFFGQFAKLPDGFNLETYVTATLDKRSANDGFASWQTPRIVARGDLMTFAGACRSHIGAAQSDALRTAYGRSDDPRERRYYDWSFDDGMTNPDWQDFSAKQCSRAIEKNREAIRATD